MPDPSSPNIPKDPRDAEFSDLIRKGEDTDDNWAWSERDKEKWEEADDGLQEFYKYWREPSHSFGPSGRFPYTLSLGDLGIDRPVRPGTTSDNKIVVTKSYHDIYYRILGLRAAQKGGQGGVVLTGQPGIGKTFYLDFMLARLISAKQVVLVSLGFSVLLFYQGKVYKRQRPWFSCIPTHKLVPFFYAWALIDADYKGQEPSIDPDHEIWPIQASSPQPNLWKRWSKQRKATVVGMPLWNMEELKEGLTLRPEYKDFRTALEFFKNNKQSNSGGFTAALEVLRRKEDKSASDEDVEMTHTADQSPDMDAEAGEAAGEPPDDMEALLKNAIEEFGWAPRDVYRGVFRLSAVRNEHIKAVHETDYSELATFATKFAQDLHLSDRSHELIAVNPIIDFPDTGSWMWTIGFKSAWVLGKVTESVRLKEDSFLWSAYNSLCGVAGASSLAGPLFEEIVHRTLAHGWDASVLRLQPIPMISDGKTPPTFSTDPSPTPTSISLFPSIATETHV